MISLDSLERDLKRTGFHKDAGTFVKEGLIVALVVAGMVFLVTQNYLFAIIVIGLVTYAYVSQPVKALRKKEALVEKNLPFFLRALGLRIAIGLSFEKALEQSCAKGFGMTSEAFNDVLKKVEMGYSFPKALETMSDAFDSQRIKRVVIYLNNLYLVGDKEALNNIFTLARDLGEHQKQVMKEYAKKVMLLSMLFIVVSAIVPSMFQVMITVGSHVLKLSFTPEQVLLITGLGFPLMNLSVIYVMINSTPEVLK